MKWRSFGATDQGKVRKLNEDAYVDLGEQNLWAVADGMGGHARGDHASKTVIRHLSEFTIPDSFADAVDDIENRILAANKELRSGADSGVEESMGTTIVVLYAHADQCALFWAGDSRIYQLRNRHLNRVSHDHGLVQDMIDQGIIQEHEGESHPYSNIVTRAVGIDNVLNVEIDIVTAAKGDKYMLCSDGLFKEVQEHEIAEFLESPPQEATEALISKTLERGAVDNVSVITIEAIGDND